MAVFMQAQKKVDMFSPPPPPPLYNEEKSD